MDHRLKQLIARVNLVHANVPELEFTPFDADAITASLAWAFKGLSLVKEAQAAPLTHAFHQHLEKGQLPWFDELLPLSITWLDSGNLKLSYINETPEAQVKLQDCYALKEHPSVCEGRLPTFAPPTANASPAPPTGRTSSPANGRSSAPPWRRSFRGTCGGRVLPSRSGGIRPPSP